MEPGPIGEDSEIPIKTEEVEPPAAQDSSGDTTGSDPYDGRLIKCDNGAPASSEEWDDGTRFEIKERGPVLEVNTFSGVWQPPQKWFTGIDFQNSNGQQTGPIPGFALGEGTTIGYATEILGGVIVNISAVRAGENGEILPWTTAATAEIGDGFVTIEIPLSEIPGGIDMIRFTLSDGEICELSGIFEIFNGFQPLPEFSAEVGVALENKDDEQVCFPDVCLSLPGGAGWVPTGDNTGNVTIGGNDFVLQVYTSEEAANGVLNVFEGSGWIAEESGEYESPLGTYQIFDLESSDQIYGSLGLLEPQRVKSQDDGCRRHGTKPAIRGRSGDVTIRF